MIIVFQWKKITTLWKYFRHHVEIFVERDKIDTPSTQIHEPHLPGAWRVFQWTNLTELTSTIGANFRLSEMMLTCKCFPPLCIVIHMYIFLYLWNWFDEIYCFAALKQIYLRIVYYLKLKIWYKGVWIHINII